MLCKFAGWFCSFAACIFRNHGAQKKAAAGTSHPQPPDGAKLAGSQRHDARLAERRNVCKNLQRRRLDLVGITAAGLAKWDTVGCTRSQGQSERPKPECRGAQPSQVAVNHAGFRAMHGPVMAARLRRECRTTIKAWGTTSLFSEGCLPMPALATLTKGNNLDDRDTGDGRDCEEAWPEMDEPSF